MNEKSINNIKEENRRKLKKQERVERLRKWYKELKRNKKCSNCGKKGEEILDFHHVNPNKKKYSISRMVSLGCSKGKIAREISKTIILCSCCHRIHHDQERAIQGKKRNLSKIQKVISALKKDKKCLYCNISRACALDFHHRNPEDKKFSIGNAIKMKLSEEDIINESKKCDLICSNCHRSLHLRT